jgi:hypothetical protein
VVRVYFSACISQDCEDYLLHLIIIAVEFICGSLMSFMSVLAFNRSKNLSSLLFIITSLLLYMEMIFHILAVLEIFTLSDIRYHDIAISDFAARILIFISMTAGLGLLLMESDSDQ